MLVSMHATREAANVALGLLKKGVPEEWWGPRDDIEVGETRIDATIELIEHPSGVTCMDVLEVWAVMKTDHHTGVGWQGNYYDHDSENVELCGLFSSKKAADEYADAAGEDASDNEEDEEYTQYSVTRYRVE